MDEESTVTPLTPSEQLESELVQKNIDLINDEGRDIEPVVDPLPGKKKPVASKKRKLDEEQEKRLTKDDIQLAVLQSKVEMFENQLNEHKELVRTLITENKDLRNVVQSRMANESLYKGREGARASFPIQTLRPRSHGVFGS